MKMKKMRGFGAKAMAVVAAIAMSAATATAAFAGWEKDKNGDPIGNTTEQIVIGKSIKMPANWEPEALNVTFKVEPVGFSTDGTAYTPVEGLGFEGKVTLNKADFTTANKVTAEEQVKYWGAETGEFINQISYKGQTGIEAIEALAKDQQSTGAVKFTVTESEFEYTDAANTFSVKSAASYDLVFWIDYVVDPNTKESSYKVTSVTDTKTKNDNGSDNNKKVDPTPESTTVEKTEYDEDGKIVPKAEEYLNYKLSGMLFNNDITKSDQPEHPDTPTVDDSAFKITKTNAGGDPNQEFEFEVELTAPELAGVKTTEGITVRVYNESGEEVTGKANTFMYGQVNTIKLKGGETAVFGQMYNSTKVVVTEKGTPSYVPSYTSTYGTSDGQVVNAGDKLSVDGVTQSKTDYVHYTNNYQSITPTGVIMNNLPFFMMILIGAVAIAAGFVFQARKKVTGR